MNFFVKKLVPALVVTVGLAACGGGGTSGNGDGYGSSADSGFESVRGLLQQDGLWLINTEFKMNKEQAYSVGNGVTVIAQTDITMNVMNQMVVDYTDDSHITLKYCDAEEPEEIMSMEEIEQDQYLSDDEGTDNSENPDDLCSKEEINHFEAVSDNQFRIRSSCGSELQAVINLTRISNKPEFNAGSLKFTKHDETSDQYLTPLDVSSGVCGSIIRSSIKIDFPDDNAYGLKDIDKQFANIVIGVLDYQGEPLMMDMDFQINPVKVRDYTVDYYIEDNDSNAVEINMDERASASELTGTNGLLTVTEVDDDLIKGNFDMTLEDMTSGSSEPYKYVGSFDLDLDPR